MTSSGKRASPKSDTSSDHSPGQEHPSGSSTCCCLATTVVVVITAICHFLSTRSIAYKSSNVTATTRATCTNDVCRHQIVRSLAAIDTSFSPCEDFYHFTCNKWIANHSTWNGSRSMAKITKRNYLNTEVWKLLRAAFEDNDSPSKSISVQFARDLFSECCNLTQRASLKLKPIAEVIESVLGQDWHSDEQHNPTDWMAMYAQTTLFNLQPIFHVNFHKEHNEDGTNFSILAMVTLPKNSKNYKWTSKVVLNRFKSAAVDVDHATAEKIIEFDNQLSSNFQPHSNEYRQFSLGKLTSLTSIDWTKLVNLIAESTELPISFTDGDQVVTNQLEYLNAASTLLKSVDPTFLKSYFALMIIENFRKQQHFATGDELEDKCIALLENHHFNYAMSRLQLDKMMQVEHLDRKQLNATKARVIHLVKELKLSFEKQLHENDWLDNETREYALEKLASMGEDISYPEWVMNDAELDRVGYNIAENTNLTVPSGQFLLGLAEWTKVVTRKQFQNVLQAKLPDFYQHGTYHVRAANSIKRNTILITNGILRWPMFNPHWPPPVIYGKMGFVLGHEITHGFDSTGRHKDKDGRPYEWWSEEANEHFINRSQCFIEQYERYEVQDVNVRIDGKKTLGENIADNSGIRVSYGAFLRHLKHKQLEGAASKPAYGTTYTLEQLFFIAFGKLYCRKYDVRYKADDVRQMVHSPARVRTNLALANFEQFARAWNCSIGSALNPEEKLKCRVY